MRNEEVLKFIGYISPQAKEYVSEAFENNEVELYYTSTKGVFLKAENPECCIFYSSFLDESNIDDVLEMITLKTKQQLLKLEDKEICFNVYGYNQKIISLVRNLGFKLDIEGYHLEYVADQPLTLISSNVIKRKYDVKMIDDFVQLFQSAYYQLNIDNNWETNGYDIYKEQFNNKLSRLDKSDQLFSFWLDDKLVGAYIIENNYIVDLVVDPAFQGKGYGSYILTECINKMCHKNIKNIRLRVTKSNTGAKKLYERHNFKEISCFSEHTLVR